MIVFLRNFIQAFMFKWEDRDFVMMFAIVVMAFTLALILAGLPETVPYDDSDDDE